MSKEIILTKEGCDELKAELEELETVKRAEVGERIKNAREFGDITENSEYDDAKNEQAWVESRIIEINLVLANATIVEAPKRSNRVAIGNKVLVQLDSGAERQFTLVGAAEADAAKGRISNESPVGAALLGARKGDEVTAEGPTGKEIKFTILKIGR
ncbi:MAG: transcription elongation factor GreA [Coriobacteriales bacterium]|jgi:transcription elongation factor GreA|nr:transcription elongation factor GreA [Coriobacteriales bacterium]